MFGIRPTRSEKMKIANLDSIITESVSFTLLGRDHTIKPVTLEQYLLITQAWASLEDLRKSEKINDEQILDAYYKCVSPVVKSLQRDDFNKLSIQQIGALLQLITKTVTGEAFGEKKTLLLK